MWHRFKWYQLEVIAESRHVGRVGIGVSDGSGSVHGSAEVAPGGIVTSSHPSTATGDDSSNESSSDEEEGPQIGEGSGTVATVEMGLMEAA